MSGWEQVVGRWGENLAARYLGEYGYQVISRNYRTPHGEIDLIALQDELLMFVEGKTRTSRTFGLPEDSIAPIKQTHMLSAAEYDLENLGEDGTRHYDVNAIERSSSGKVEIQHFVNVLN